MILRNHGLLTLGRTVREAFILMYNLEQSCRTQLDALAAVGRAGVTLIPDAVVERTRQQVYRPRGDQDYRDWPALLRMLDRRGIDFRS
jgi:ribulose-5-phosphate 4-epimerase/fuculose-1-phosphate aldolase